MKKLLVVSAGMLCLSGCMSLDKVIEQTDYACVGITLDGPTTDSTGRGLGIKVPDGEQLTPELMALLCQDR